MNMIKKTIARAALGASLGFAATGASADIIENWSFSVTGAWQDAVFGGGTGAGQTFSSATLLSWGASNPPDQTPIDTGDSSTSRSGLTINNPLVEGMIETGGAAADTIVIEHDNNTILTSFDTLQSAVFVTTLTLTPFPASPGDPTFGPVSQEVPILFAETRNTNNPSTCGFVSTSACDDIFLFFPETLTFDFFFEGVDYTTTIGAPGLGLLPPATCAAAGGSGTEPCVGLQTQEELTSAVQFNFIIEARERPVPAPATLALLGLGMLGVAARKRAKRA